MLLSLPAVAISSPLCDHATQLTASEWPVNLKHRSRSFVFHKFTVLSVDEDANLSDIGLYAKLVISPWCPRYCRNNIGAYSSALESIFTKFQSFQSLFVHSEKYKKIICAAIFARCAQYTNKNLEITLTTVVYLSVKYLYSARIWIGAYACALNRTIDTAGRPNGIWDIFCPNTTMSIMQNVPVSKAAVKQQFNFFCLVCMRINFGPSEIMCSK